MKKPAAEKPSRTVLKRITRISALSFILVIMTFVGLYAGVYIDKITNMSPNFTFLGLILGIALGFRGFIQEVLVERRGES